VLCTHFHFHDNFFLGRATFELVCKVGPSTSVVRYQFAEHQTWRPESSTTWHLTEAVKDETANLKPPTDFFLGTKSRRRLCEAANVTGVPSGRTQENSVDVTSSRTLRPLPPEFDFRSYTESEKVLAYRQVDNYVTESETFETLISMLFA
jgi:hypothetical protein